MVKSEQRRFEGADERRDFPNGKAEILKMTGGVALPSGHDAWVVGDEPVVVIDWCGATHYGERH